MSKEIDIMEDVQGAGDIVSEIRSLAEGAPTLYNSIKGTDFEAKKQTYSAVSNAKRIREHLGEVINLRNVIVQPVELANESTGELTKNPRVILIDEDGTAFYGISNGLFRSIGDVIGMLGEPDTWPEAIPVTVKELQGKGANRFYTIELV